MNKIVLQAISLCCMSIASCSNIDGNLAVLPPNQKEENTETPDRLQDYTGLINKTISVPSDYGQEARHKGEVVRIDYDTRDYADANSYCEALPEELANDLIPVVESRYRTYAETTDAAGLECSREHRAIGGFSMGAVTTWYALEHTLPFFKYFMPVSADCWSLGRFASMNRPDDTARVPAFG